MAQVFEAFSVEMADARFDDSTMTIKGVKLNGPKSRNGREYPGDTLDAATPLFEGCLAFTDHYEDGQRPWDDGPRKIKSIVGRVTGVRFNAAEGSHRGDVRVRPSMKAFYEDLKADPKMCGMSQVIEGDFTTRVEPDSRRAIDVCSKITRVLSVDFVVDPATTKSVFESAFPGAQEEQMSATEGVMKIQEVLLKDREDKIKALEAQIKEGTAAHAALVERAVKAEKAMEETLKALAETKKALEGVQAAQGQAELQRLAAEAALPPTVVKVLEGMPLDKAKALVESFREAGPRSAMRAAEGTSKAGKSDPNLKSRVIAAFRD